MTTRASHTPGQWKAAFPVGNPPFVSNEGTVVVQKVGPLSNRIEAEANARLIAAAPAMREALEHIIETADGAWDQEDLDRRQGRSRDTVARDRFNAIHNIAQAALALAEKE